MNDKEQTYSIYEALEISRKTGFAISCTNDGVLLKKLKVKEDGIHFAHDGSWSRIYNLNAEYLAPALRFILDDTPNPFVFTAELVGCDELMTSELGGGTIYSFKGDHRALAFEGKMVKVTLEVVGQLIGK
jgi:hypothetical protein